MKSFKKFLSMQEAKEGYCSDECCGSDVKAEDCPCPPTCPHCDCNAKAVEETFDPKHPKVVAARKAHKAGTYDGNVDKNGNAIVHIDGKPHTVTKGDPAAKNEGIGDNIKSALSFPKRKITGNHLDNAIKQHDDERKSHANAASKAKIIGTSGLTKKQKASYNDSKEMHHRAGEKHHTIAKNHLKAAQTANNKNKMDQAHKHMTDYHKHQDHKTFGKEVHVSKLRKMGTTNEAVDQLDELSPATLKSYKKKATKQYKQSANKRMPGGGDYGSATKAAQDKHQKRFDKRHKGIGSEIKRTTDSDIHLKDPKGLVRKNPKANSMTGKPAPYKNRAESLDEDTINQLTAEYINENNITMVELEAMSPEQLDEIIGKAIGGLAKAAIKTGAAAIRGGKAAAQRVSTAGRAAAAEKKADSLEKKKADRDRIQSAKDRVKAAKDSLRKKTQAAAAT